MAGGNWLYFSLVGGLYSRMFPVWGMIVVARSVVSFWGFFIWPVFVCCLVIEQQPYDITVIRYGLRKCVTTLWVFIVSVLESFCACNKWGVLLEFVCCLWGKQQHYKFMHQMWVCINMTLLTVVAIPFPLYWWIL